MRHGKDPGRGLHTLQARLTRLKGGRNVRLGWGRQISTEEFAAGIARGDGRMAGDVTPVKTGERLFMSTSLNSTTAFGLIDRFARYARRFVLLGLVLSPSMVMAQEAQIIQPGSMTVTGFSGTVIPGIEEGLPPGVSPIDETLIDLEGKTLRIFDVTNLGGPASGQVVNTPLPFEVPARQIGQVFGIAYDDGVRTDTTEIVPNVYVGATSLHGLQIVSPDEDEDGRPERQRRGTENAVFMDGQFGLDLGGGPGSVYKIDGLTGQVSKFADIEGNSGPGLGNLKFDKAHRQFFVSDLDTGLIHRISADGALIDTFDHGVAGRPVRSLEPVSDDGSVMDIKGGTFDTEDPETWGYTQDERRVWGVAVHGGRLYYAVGDEAEIWSVDILEDGAFGTARWELTVKAEKDYPVTDIAFDNRGFMYLSQRGEIENRYDYSRFANSGKGEVIRYWRESPDDPATESIWVESPQEYAVGFPPENRQAAGGLDLQYDYDANGFINPSGSCTGTLVKTGDDLRNNPELESQLAAGGPLVVHGVQLTPIELVKPNNVPPFGSWFVDYDNLFEDPDVKGHVGDVEVWRPCAGRAAWYDPIPYPGDYPDPYYPPYFPPGKNPCIDIRSVEYFCTPAGLEADIYITDTAGFGGDSLKTDSLSPGVSVTPPMQTVPNLSTPFTYNITGHVPGDKVRLGLCFYKDADAKKGGYFPCCKVNADIQTPAVSCEP
jgi:hypothetical protein